MPGAYAHITLVNILKETERLEAIPDFPVEAITAVLDYFKFCELGAVSPDYPYLAVGDKNAAKWADAMHYTRTGEMIKAGVKRLQNTSGEDKRKGLAWLLGYAAHVATDVTIHPVVELKVGPYAGNETAHRVCEMHQDAHIFQRLNLGGIGLSEHLDSGIGRCNAATDRHALDSEIRQLWEGMLQDVHPQDYNNNPPDLNKWHNGFMLMVDTIAEEGNRLMPLARHVAVNLGLTYPAADAIEEKFIKRLASPGGHMKYDALFDLALKNVGRVWQLVASGAMAGDGNYLAQIGNWNLDTGRDADQNLALWG